MQLSSPLHFPLFVARQYQRLKINFVRKEIRMNSFLGQIIILPINYAPANYALCNGQLLPIAQYLALFSLIGTSFGGNGTTDFALPNYSGQAPAGSNYFICVMEVTPQA
jgi:hypothetical protein